MKRTTYASKLRSIAEHYGPMSQLSKTAEELSEATSAVMRYSQRPTKLHFKQMAEEFADRSSNSSSSSLSLPKRSASAKC